MKLLSAVFSTVLLLFVSVLAHAQLPDPVAAAKAVNPASGHNYIGIGGETVNPADGSLSFDLKLNPATGRQLSMPFGIRYASPEHFYITNTNPAGMGAGWTNLQAAFGDTLVVNGWSYDVPKLTGQTSVTGDFYDPPISYGGPDYDPSTLSHCISDTGYVFYGIDGIQRGLDSGVMYGDPNNSKTHGCSTQVNTYSNHDGVIATSPSPSWYSRGTQPVTVVDSSGTAYKFDASPGLPNLVDAPNVWGLLANSITDRNGNQIVLNSSRNGYVDTLGRTAVFWTGIGNSSNEISIAGLSGNIVLHWAPVSYNFALTGYAAINAVGNAPFTPFQGDAANGSGMEISEIDLPNGQKYRFAYESHFGKVSQIWYPGGGYVRYGWNWNYSAASVHLEGMTGATSYNPPQRIYGEFIYDMPAVVDRWVSYDGQNEVLHQHFDYSTSRGAYVSRWDAKTTTVTSTDLVTGQSTVTVYTYTWNNLAGTGGYSDPVPYEKSIVYKNSSGAVYKTTNKTWAQYWGSMMATSVVLAGEQTVLENGQSTTTLNCYDTNGQVTATYEYGFSNELNGTSSPTLPGCATTNTFGYLDTSAIGPRKQVTTTSYHPFFQRFKTAVYGSDYDGGILGTHVVNAPDSITVQDGSGNQVQQTQYTYTDSVSSSGAATGRAALPGPNRANVATVVRWRSSDNSSPTTSYTWYDTGQLASKTEPCGYLACPDVEGSGQTTSYTYSSNSAYLSQVTYPNTGAAHSESFSWDNNTGQLLSRTDDQNGTTTSYQYSDVLGRVTQITNPDGGSAQFSYNDGIYSSTYNTPSVTTTKKITGSQNVVNTTAMDGMGHTVRSIADSYPGGPVIVDTTYNGFGNVRSVSNPHRSGAAADGWTTYDYDPLGRQTLLTHPDNTTVTTQYEGNTTTVTDETSRQRKSEVDGLGRLVKVTEPNPDTGSLSSGALITTYGYDALNNLTSILQNGSRPRSFTYDSLSQLRSATNPESGTSTYEYDFNGNLSRKIAPSPNDGSSSTVAINYIYDNLNRLKKKQYSDSTAPSTCFQYDQSTSGSVTNGAGRLVNEWTQTGNCASAPPADAITRRSFKSYDAMGRVTDESQCTPFNCNVGGRSPYSVTHQYDYLGNEVLHTNGIGSISFTAGYNGANLLGNFSSSWEDATHPASLFTATAFGPAGLTDAIFGTNLNLHRDYDARMRLTSETDTGYIVQTPAAAASALLQISGPEKSTGVPTGATGAISIIAAPGVQDTPGSATVAINGTLQAPKQTQWAAAGTGSVTISGSEQSWQSQTAAATQASGAVTINGTLQSKQVKTADATSGSTTFRFDSDQSAQVYTYQCSMPYQTNCPVDYYNYAYVYFENVSLYEGYGWTNAQMANDLARSINANSSSLWASASGDYLTITARAKGAATNRALDFGCGWDTDHFSSCPVQVTGSLTLSGGHDDLYTTVYDSGTTSITVNGQTFSRGWGSGSMAAGVAAGLASDINAGSPYVSASVSGATIYLTSKQSGVGTNYSLSTSTSFNSSNFNSSSFSGSLSGSTLTDGKDATYATNYDAGTTTVVVNGHPTSYGWEGAYTNSSNIATGIAQAINSDSGAVVTARISDSSNTTVELTARSSGVATNYSLSSSTSSQRGSFSSSTVNGITALRGGKNNDYLYDSGTATITINGQTLSTSWSGSGTTSSSIAAALAGTINASSSYATASISGSAISLTAKLTAKAQGSSTNYSLASAISHNSSDFPTTVPFSTTPSGTVFTGGTDATSTQAGTAVLSVGSSSVSASYSAGDTSASIVSKLAAALVSCSGSALVYASSASGSTLGLTSCGKGASVNYPLSFAAVYDSSKYSAPAFTGTSSSMSGGTDTGATVYDHGTVTLTINGVSGSTNYGQNSTPESVAAGLASAFPGNSQVKVAQVTDPQTNRGTDTLRITARTIGTSGNNYTYQVSSSYDTANFSSASFSGPSSGSLSSGQDEIKARSAVYSYAVNYHGNGNVASANDSVMGAWSYPNDSYDALNRLTKAVSSSGPYGGITINWSYDAWGNRLNQTPTSPDNGQVPYNWAHFDNNPSHPNNGTNRVISAPERPAGYDYSASGNVLNDGRNQYTYDAENRIVAEGPTSGGVTTRYVYNAEGQRVAKLNTSGAVLASYVLGLGGEQMTEMDASGNWVHTNVFAGGKLMATYDNQGLHFHANDWLGTRRVQTRYDGALELAFRSLPFGDGLSTDAYASSSDTTEHHFTSKERDVETGNDYFLARYYASNAGRFLTPDWAARPTTVPYAVFGDPQTLNLYTYVENAPLNRIDADGHLSAEAACQTQGTKCGANSYADKELAAKQTQAAQSQSISNKIKSALTNFARAEVEFLNTYVQEINSNIVFSGVSSPSADNGVQKAAVGMGFVAGFIVPEGEAGKGATSVYSIGRDYVGITNNLGRRAGEHGKSLTKIAGGLTTSGARGVEQALIEHHGLGKNGGTLTNRINSIAKTNPIYGKAVEFGRQLLQSIGYLP